MIHYLLKHLFLGPILRLLAKPKVEGAENIPKSGGALLASNHLAVTDSFFLPMFLNRKVTFPAKRDYFSQPGLSGKFKKWFFIGMGQVPVDPGSGAMETGIRLLRQGHLLGIYPEGTRSPDGRLYRGKTGVARLALEAHVPVIPVAMIGTDKVQFAGSKLWHAHSIRIIVGKPLDFSRYYDLAGDRFVERAITDEIMFALLELSGQEYVDMYASAAKEVLSAEAEISKEELLKQRRQLEKELADARRRHDDFLNAFVRFFFPVDSSATEYMTGLLADEIPPEKLTVLPVRYYISTDETNDALAVERALSQLATTIGFILNKAEDRQAVGSFFRKMFMWTRSPAAQERLLKVEQAVEAHMLQLPQAQTYSELAQGVANVLSSLETSNQAIVQLGPVLILKMNESTIAFTLTSREQSDLEREPHLFRDPETVLARIKSRRSHFEPDASASGLRSDSESNQLREGQ